MNKKSHFELLPYFLYVIFGKDYWRQTLPALHLDKLQQPVKSTYKLPQNMNLKYLPARNVSDNVSNSDYSAERSGDS